MKIESTPSETNFEISPMELQEDKFTYLNHSLTSRNISLLSHSFTNLLSVGGLHIGSSTKYTTGFLLGCLREVRVGKHLLTFTSRNVAAESNPRFSLAKSAFMSANLSNIQIGCHSNNACATSPCGSGGTCVEIWNDFHCACKDGHYGHRCEFNPCTLSPCVTGTCTTVGSGFNCSCARDYVGVYCNETCTSNLCKNGGKCGISGGNIACTCESGFTGGLCESPVPRDDDDDDDDDDLPLIVGISCAGGVLLLLIVAVVFVCTRQTSSTFGKYSPSTEEKLEARVEMNPVMNVPPPEKLI